MIPRTLIGSGARTVVVLMAWAASALSAPPVHADLWPMYMHDTSRSGRSDSSFSPASLRFAWQAPGGFTSPLIVGNSIIAVGPGSGGSTVVRSFAQADGATNWEFTPIGVTSAQVSVSNGLLVYPSHSPDQVNVYDASTGAHLYSVPVPGITTQSQSTLVFDDATNSLTAYISSSSGIRQVHLGADSGSVGWAAEAACGGGFPALVGNSLVCASPGRYYAIDQTSGAVNQFQAGGLSGGGNATPAYDPVRDQFYILEMFNSPTPVLSAYHYSGNGSISLLWQRSGPGFNAGSGLALDADGNIYTAASTTLQKLDPSDGATIDSATPPSAFIAGMAPILNAGYIWADTGSQSLAFDLETLSLAGTFPGMRGSSNTPFKARGVLGDSAYVMDLTGISPQQGFKVYMVPEPVTACLLLLGFWMARPSRTRRRRLQGT